MSEEGEHPTQEVRQFQIQIQNSRNDRIEARKMGKIFTMKRGGKKNQNIGLVYTSMSTVICECGVSGVIYIGREEAKNMEFQKVTSLVKMDFGLSIEKGNNDEEYKVQKKKGNLKKLARGQNKENEMGRDVASSIVGVKQTLWVDEEKADAGRQKKFCGSNSIPFDLSAVSVEQHHREP